MQARLGSVAAVVDEPDNFCKGYYSSKHESVTSSIEGGGVDGGDNAMTWKKFTSKELGISNESIPRSTRVVLNGLKRRAFELVFAMQQAMPTSSSSSSSSSTTPYNQARKPKDFDILTSAELKEMIGRRFPIFHVHVDGTTVEVSSFSTSTTRSRMDRTFDGEQPVDLDKEDYIRWRNCLQRDFTINGLMLDTCAKMVYDYMGGVEDIRKAKVQTVNPSSISFWEDCAWVLRGIRIAARLGFRFTRETAHNVKNLAHLVLNLDKGRVHMEMNYMLAYGSAESSFRLLWKFGVLDILLPIQAAYFVRQGFRRRDKRSNMLLVILDYIMLIACFLHPTLSPLMLASPLMLHNFAGDSDNVCFLTWISFWPRISLVTVAYALSDKPRNPFVVAAFGLVHNGGDMSEALDIARKISRPHETSFYELLEPRNLDSEKLKDEVMHLDESVRSALSSMTDEYYVSQAMARYPKAPKSDLVFISLELYLRVCKIFECVKVGKRKGIIAKQGSEIDHELLSLGNLQEVRHVFARILFDTAYSITLSQET